MKSVVKWSLALLVPLAFSGCAVVPAGPYYGGPVVAAPPPVVVTPSFGFGYYRGWGGGYHRGWGHRGWR